MSNIVADLLHRVSEEITKDGGQGMHRLLTGNSVLGLEHHFVLNGDTKKEILSRTPEFGYGVLSQIVYARTYSRTKADGSKETWGDTIVRVVEGILSIRKNYFLRHGLAWNDEEWQEYAKGFADSMYRMEHLPPGRGLWACGSEFVERKGAAALYNCGCATLTDLVKGATWVMDALMTGIGCGTDTLWDGVVVAPQQERISFVVGDSREEWVESLGALLRAFIPDENGKTGAIPIFDYSRVRPSGSPIKGFGGTASGPGPLKKLHIRVAAYLSTYLHWKNAATIEDKREILGSLVEQLRQEDYEDMDTEAFRVFKAKVMDTADKKEYDRVRCCVDIINAIGCCVVAGNVRRSAEIILGEPADQTFLNLKNYDINPERCKISWMSNNSVRLRKTEDFAQIPDIAQRIRVNGEPGAYNLINVKRYGRVGHYHNPEDAWTREYEQDEATLGNPCVTGDTLVLTAEGWRTVKSLVGEKFDAVMDGKIYPSTNQGFWSTGKKQVYELLLSNGMKVKCTDNHKILTKRGWVELKDLKVREDIVKCTKTPEVPSAIASWDEYMQGYVCGQIIGDGCTSKSKAKEPRDVPVVNLWLIREEDRKDPMKYTPYAIIQNWVMGYIKRVGSCAAIECKGFFRQKTTVNYDRYTLCTVALCGLIEKFGIKPIEKKVYELGGIDFTRGLLCGFFDADGSISDAKRSKRCILLTQTKLYRLEAVQRLLLMFGIESKIYTNCTKEGKHMLPDNRGQGKLKEYECQASHDLCISDQRSVRLFAKHIGFRDNAKNTKLANMLMGYKMPPQKETRSVKAWKITPLGVEEVYDCTIPEVHAFCAQGITVHNCLEVCLSPFELCNLSEVFIPRCCNKNGTFSLKRYHQALCYATFYSTTVSLHPTHWPETNAVIGRNRRIGVSLSGIAQYYDRYGSTELIRILRAGYKTVRETNTALSRSAGVPPAVRVTVVKPSGSISLLAGVSPGMHFPHFNYYIRRIRIASDSPIVTACRDAGYKIVKDEDSDNTDIIEFVISSHGTRASKDVSVWEQMALLATLQREWADNAVSSTITFKPDTEGPMIEKVLAHHLPELKSVSMLPYMESGVYKNAPYEGITQAQYEAILATHKSIDMKRLQSPEDGAIPKYCTNDTCTM